jgi:betaine-aldehyde dehydrogenase
VSQATDQTHLLQNVIGGVQRPAADGRTTAVIDPSTGVEYARAPLSGAEDVDAAYRAASDAFTTWGRTTPAERQLALLRLADAIEQRADEFVAVESRNTGKPLHLTATDEVPPCVDQLRFFAGAARVLDGLSAGEYMAGHTSCVRREPVGDVGQVTPWN